MGILSRKIMKGIMFRSRHEFNPYIVGSSIDEGMWGLSK